DKETDGRTWERIDYGSSSSSRFKKTWKDWMGHEIHVETPGFNTTTNYAQDTNYNATSGQNSTGHMYRKTKAGSGTTPFVTRIDYDIMGQAFRTGLDVNDNGLVLASNDRITDTNEYLEYFSSNYWWRKDTVIY